MCCCFHTAGSLHWGGGGVIYVLSIFRICTDRCFEVAPDIKAPRTVNDVEHSPAFKTMNTRHLYVPAAGER